MLKNIIWSLFGKKYLLGMVTELYRKTEGYRTAIFTGLAVVIYILKTLQYIPAELADQLLAVCAGSGTVTMTSKFNRWDNDFKVQERMAELKAEALQRLQADGVIPAKIDDRVTDGLCQTVLPDTTKNDGVRG